MQRRAQQGAGADEETEGGERQAESGCEEEGVEEGWKGKGEVVKDSCRDQEGGGSSVLVEIGVSLSLLVEVNVSWGFWAFVRRTWLVTAGSIGGITMLVWQENNGWQKDDLIGYGPWMIVMQW